MLKLNDSSGWNKDEYKELLEYVDSLVIAKTLEGSSVRYYVFKESLHYNIEEKVSSGFEISAPFISLPKIKFFFHDENFVSSGLKGNLKNEGFKYNVCIETRGNYDFIIYTFSLEKDTEKYIKQIKRLFRYFRKYI